LSLKASWLVEYQDLKSEFERAANNLIKEAIRSKGIKLESGQSDSYRETTTPRKGCEYCSVCIIAVNPHHEV
jgi:hypothetical protein